MDFKYIIEYSLEYGEIANTLGCHTLSQAKEIAQIIYDGYSDFGNFTVDFVRVCNKEGQIIKIIQD